MISATSITRHERSPASGATTSWRVKTLGVEPIFTRHRPLPARRGVAGKKPRRDGGSFTRHQSPPLRGAPAGAPWRVNGGPA